MKKTMTAQKDFLAAAAGILLLLAACDNAVSPDTDSLTDEFGTSDGSPDFTFVYSAAQPDVSRLMRQWQWKIHENPDFKLQFENNGSISSIHCCDLLFSGNGGYLLVGNILITIGTTDASHSGGTSKFQATTFTMSDDGLSFKRSNGSCYDRGLENTYASPNAPVVLSNNLLGTWQGEEGTEYEFSPDTGLRISPSGSNSGQYEYTVYKNDLLTLGPLVDGEPAAVWRYRFNQKGGKIYLLRSDGQKDILSPIE